MARELQTLILFNGQAIYSKSLFEPDTKDMQGQPLKKPSYSLIIRFPKTTKNWYEEPALRGFRDACKVVMTREMPTVPYERIEFPIKDGDEPNKKNKVPDWAKGHWFIRASSTFAPKVEQQVNGVNSELPSLMMGNQRIWGDGDYCGVAMSLAKRLSDDVGIRCYLNAVLFTKKGVELNLTRADVDWAAATSELEAQGGKVERDAPDFTNGPFGGAGSAFNPGAGNPFNPGAGAPFGPGAAGGGFNPGSAAGANTKAPF